MNVTRFNESGFDKGWLTGTSGMNRGVSAARPEGQNDRDQAGEDGKTGEEGRKIMGAVMQIAVRREMKTQGFPAFVARRAGSADDGELGPAMRKISQLNTEIQTLRAELERAQRTILREIFALRTQQLGK